MQNNIKFSIIVPVYNVEKYLSKCLDSLINQTYSNIEIICINDGSKDKSLQILKEYFQKDNRIKIIDKENEGVSIARNTGINQATGDYILFVDSDDWLELNTCENLAEQIINYEYPDIIQFQYKVKGLGINRNSNTPVFNKKFKVLDKLEEILINWDITSCWDRAYKFEFLKSNKIVFPINIKTFEDFIFIINLYICNPQMIVIKDYCYNYFLNIDSICHSDSLTKLHLHQEALTALKFLLQNTENEELKLLSYNHYLRNINSLWNTLYFSKYKMEYLCELQKSRKLFPKTFKSKSIQSCDLNLKLAKYHISWLYWKILRPIGKYLIVLPFRKLRKIWSKR